MAMTAERETGTAKTVRLHRNAPWATDWNPRLVNTYRDWFAQHEGRYFKVSAKSLNTLWEIEEITADGTWVTWVTVCARNLPAARMAIADFVAGVDTAEITLRMLTAPGAPTGRAARQIRIKQREQNR